MDLDENLGYPLELFINRGEALACLCKICARVCRTAYQVDCKTANKSYLCCEICYSNKKKSDNVGYCPFLSLEKTNTNQPHELKEKKMKDIDATVLSLKTNCPFKQGNDKKRK